MMLQHLQRRISVVAIGTGTDVAMEAADITLIRGDLNSIADAIFMSKMNDKNIKQNLFWALAYNGLGIPIAALGFLAPWVAGQRWHLVLYRSY